MERSFAHAHPAVMALLWSLPVIGLAIVLGWRLGDEAGHAASHLVVGIPALALLASSRRWRETRPGRTARVARRSLIIGLGILGGGQVVEAVGAFGFDGYARQYELLAALHDAALVLSPIALLFLVVAGVATLAAILSKRAWGWRAVSVATVVVLAAFSFKVIFGA